MCIEVNVVWETHKNKEKMGKTFKNGVYNPIETAFWKRLSSKAARRSNKRVFVEEELLIEEALLNDEKVQQEALSSAEEEVQNALEILDAIKGLLISAVCSNTVGADDLAHLFSDVKEEVLKLIAELEGTISLEVDMVETPEVYHHSSRGKIYGDSFGGWYVSSKDLHQMMEEGKSKFHVTYDRRKGYYRLIGK